MFFSLEILALIVIALVLSRQSSRITKLEAISKGVKPTAPASQPVAMPMAATYAQPQAPGLASASVISTPPTVQPPTAPPASQEASSGKILAGIGIAAVVIGVGFFLNYAFDNNWIGPAGRVMIGIIGGVVLLGVGQWLRKKYVGYSDFLMGGGIAVLYLSIFSAHFYFHLISPGAAGVAMLVVTALGFAISIANATIVLALVSTIGGFATPFLSASGRDDMVTIFAYLTLLNLGVLGVSAFKKWPALTIAALVGTIVNFSVWFVSFYKPEHMGATLTFCFVSFLIFLFASVARAVTAKAATDQANYFVIGVNAFIFATMGYVLLAPKHDAVLGFAAVFVALIFMVVAFIVNRANPEDKALNIFLPGLAVTFLSLAVPLQFSGPWIAVAWLVESVFLYVIASFISNRGFQIMGVIVYFLGLVNLFAWNFPNVRNGYFVAIWNSHFMILILAVIVAYTIAYIYKKYGSLSIEIQTRGIVLFVIVANVLSIYAVSSQIVYYYDSAIRANQVEYSKSLEDASRYNTGYDTSGMSRDASAAFYAEQTSLKNRSNTWVSIFLTVYAAILTAIGFGWRKSAARRMGLALFVLTAIKVFFDIWSLGQIYRIISFIVFGIIALMAAFAYNKYKDRL